MSAQIGLTPEQMVARGRGIGGSDAAAIVGMSPWTTALELYSQKRAEIAAPDLSGVEAVRWGQRLEAVIADAYAEETGHEVREHQQQLVHPDHPFILGYIDRAVTDGAGQTHGLECKNVDFFAWRAKWGEPGTDEVPDHYYVQVQHYMGICGWPRFDVAALVGGNRLYVYPVERNEDVIEQLFAAEVRFWNEHVLAGNPPEPEALSDMALLYPREERDAVYAGGEDERLVQELREVRRQQKQLEQKEGALQLRLQRTLGDAAELWDSSGRRLATWRTERRRRIDTRRLRAEHPELAEQYASESEGRTFRLAGNR